MQSHGDLVLCVLSPAVRVYRLPPASSNPLLEAVLLRLWELVSRWLCWQRLLAPLPSWELPQSGMRRKCLCARQGPGERIWLCCFQRVDRE